MVNPIIALLDEMGAHCNMTRSRSYSGQPHTIEGIRGSRQIQGISLRDLRDCYIRAFCLSDGVDHPIHHQEALKGEHAVLCENDIYELNVDPMAVLQNLMCELERLMNKQEHES